MRRKAPSRWCLVELTDADEVQIKAKPATGEDSVVVYLSRAAASEVGYQLRAAALEKWSA
jgi:hypothetical protein